MTEPEYFPRHRQAGSPSPDPDHGHYRTENQSRGMDTKLADLDRMANRWKGGFAVVLALGAVAGALLEMLIKPFFQPLKEAS
jgi:hypothetical protein